MNYDGAGGGFMSPGPQGSQGERKQFKGQQSMRPVTIKMILSADHPQTDENKFYINDGGMSSSNELSQVQVCGLVRTVQRQSTTNVWVVDDGTGTIDVRCFISEQDSALVNEKKHAVMEGNYIMVSGSVRSFKERRSVNAFQARVITDFNEITQHNLDVIHTHLQLRHGRIDSKAGLTGSAGVAPMKPAMTSAAPTPMDTSSDVVGSGADDCTKAVFEIIKDDDPDNEQGLNIHEVTRRLQNHFTQESVRMAIDSLANNGAIYTTIDEDHYKTI